jgi:hypothetical protein
MSMIPNPSPANKRPAPTSCDSEICQLTGEEDLCAYCRVVAGKGNAERDQAEAHRYHDRRDQQKAEGSLRDQIPSVRAWDKFLDALLTRLADRAGQERNAKALSALASVLMVPMAENIVDMIKAYNDESEAAK